MVNRSRLILLGCGLCLLAGAGIGRALELSDLFNGRETATGESFLVSGNNRGATREPQEPRHAGAPGGKSVWISWLAPTNGLVTLTTAGSSFDTLLAAYVLKPGDDAPLARIEPVAEQDDDDDAVSTKLQFGVRGGQRYEIAVDGFAAASGDIRLQLDLLTSADLLPSVLRRPGDRAIQEGDTLILTIDVQSTEKLDLHWYFNDAKIPDEEEPSLVIPNFQPHNVGRYRLRMEVNDFKFFSAPVEIQINSEGIVSALAKNKLEDAAQDRGVLASWISMPPAGRVSLADAAPVLARGYNGTQIFNTTYATRDPLEPQHCGIAGGASYWFSYRPPDSGEMTINTEGSNYDTLLAVYTSAGPLTSYADLIPITCDDNSGANGRTSRVGFTASSDQTYLIVIDGANGAKGIARLNYALQSPSVPSAAPSILESPRSQAGAVGATLALQVVATGRSPLSYQWYHDGTMLLGENRPALALPALQDAAAGTYSVSISNAVGQVTSDLAQIEVLSSPVIQVDPDAARAAIGFPAIRGFQYQVQTADHALSAGWNVLTNALTDSGGIVWITNQLEFSRNHFFRLKKP